MRQFELLPKVESRALPPMLYDNNCQLVLARNPLIGDIKRCRVEPGILFYVVCNYLDNNHISRRILKNADILLNGRIVPWQEWKTTTVNNWDIISIYPRVHGGGDGKNPLATIAMLVVVAAGAWIGGGGLGAVLGSSLFSGATATVIGAGIMLGGSLLIGALFPNTASLGTTAHQYQDDKVYAIESTQNSQRPYESLPVVVGKIRIAPDYAAKPYTVLSGNDQYVRNLFLISAGDVSSSDYRIGDTDVAQYTGANLYVHKNWRGETLNYFDHKISEIAENVALTNARGWLTRTSPVDTKRACILVSFPRGLTKIYNDGSRQPQTAEFEVQYRVSGSSDWTAVPGQWQINQTTLKLNGYQDQAEAWVVINPGGGAPYLQSRHTYKGARYIAKISVGPDFQITVLEKYYTGNITSGWPSDYLNLYVGAGIYHGPGFFKSAQTTSLQRLGCWLDFPAPGQYDIRVCRTTADSDANATDPTVLDESTLMGIQYHTTDKSIVYRGRPLTLVELQLKASEELSGNVSTFNCMAQSYGQIPNSGGGFTRQSSQNPAALALELMTSSSTNARPIPWNRIDQPAFRDFYNFCEKYGWKFNHCFTDGGRLGEKLVSILAAGLGGINRNKALYSVAWDAPDQEPVDMATPRTAWGFELTKEFPTERIDGLRMEFLNEDKNFQADERLVYIDGVNAANAQNVQQWSISGVTNSGLVWKHGRLRLAAMRLRPEKVSWYTDWRSIDYKRGQVIRVSYDTYKVGSGVGGVVRLLLNSDSQCIGVELDSYFSMDAGQRYIARDASKASNKYWPLQTIEGESNIAYFEKAIPQSQAPTFQSVIAIGIAGQDTMEVTIQEVEPMENFTARIRAIPTAPRILEAISGNIPEWDSMLTTDSYYQRNKPATPQVISDSIRTDEYVLLQTSSGALIPRIEVGFSIPATNRVAIDIVYIQVRRADGSEEWRQAGTAYPQEGVIYAGGVEERVEYQLRLVALSSAGVFSDFSPAYTVTVIGRTTPPPPPITIHLDGTRIWWEMPENYPIDVRGWEVWMGMDAQDPFSYAKKLVEPYTPVMEFDIEPWSGWARRVWVCTIDDIGLTSAPISIAINLGDVIVDNIVFSVLENQHRNWPGQISSGYITAWRSLAPDATGLFWERPGSDGQAGFWGALDFWGINSTLSMQYVSTLAIPEQALNSWFSLIPELPYGSLASIEYRFGASEPIWSRNNFWNINNFWGWGPDSKWQVMPSKLFISKADTIIQIRLTTLPGSAGRMDELTWLFDVEDEIDYANDIDVPAGGARVPVNKAFRWIKNISFGVEYFAGGQAVNAMWLDKGIITDGIVSQGPSVICRDAGGQSVAGKVDVTMQGAKYGA